MDNNCIVNGLNSYPLLTESIKRKVGNNSQLFSEYAAIAVHNNFRTWYNANHTDELVLDEGADNYTGADNIVKAIVQYYKNIDLDGSKTITESHLEETKRHSAGFNSNSDYDYCVTRAGQMIAAAARVGKEKGIGKEKLFSYCKQVLCAKLILAMKDNILHAVIPEKEIQTATEACQRYNAKAGISELDIISVLNYAVKNKHLTNKKVIDEIKAILSSDVKRYDLKLIKLLKCLYDAGMTSSQSVNVIALYDNIANIEMYKNQNINRFYDDLMIQPGVYEIFSKISKSEENSVEYVESIAGEDTPDVTSSEEGEEIRDESFRLMEHSGLFKDFMQHADGAVISYLMSVPKMVSADEDSPIDTNNPLGISEAINYKMYIYTIMAAIDKGSIDRMIASMKMFAKTHKGFEAMACIARDMSEDTTLAYQMYNNFAKPTVSKLISEITSDKTNVKISNITADRIAKITYDYMNSARYSGIKADYTMMTQKAEMISNALKDYQNLETDEEEADAQASITKFICDALKVYYTDITEETINSFLQLNEHDTYHNETKDLFTHNAEILISHLKKAISAGLDIAGKYDAMLSKVHAANLANNKEKARFIEELDAIDPDDSEGLRKVVRPKLINVNDIFAEGYSSSESESAAIELAKILEPFSIVKTKLNSPDVHRHLSSDAINNSMLMNLKETINRLGKNANGKNNDFTQSFADFRFEGNQYNFSNILIEHKNGYEIINYGLFRLNNNGEYELTEYANELLQVCLYNGADNIDTNRQASYDEMSPGDFFATAVRNYFNSSQSKTNKTLNFGTYFTRINSDAPKIFTIRAPRYKVTAFDPRHNTNDSLYEYADVSGTNASNLRIRKVVNANARINDDLFMNLRTKSPFADAITVSRKDFIEVLKNNKTHFVLGNRIQEKNIKSFNGNDYIWFEDSETQAQIFFKGVYDEKAKQFKVTELLGFDSNNTTTRSMIDGYLNELAKSLLDDDIKAGRVVRRINRNHALFKQFRQSFVQELTDMADAVDYMFDTHVYDGLRGGIVFDNGSAKFRHGLTNDGVGARKLYNKYHYNGAIIKDGKLTGNVFKSDKFTVTLANGDTRNYGQEILDSGLFQILDYTETGSEHKLLYKKEGNKIEVVLSTDQNQIIDDKIEEWINAYISRGKERMVATYSDFLDETYLEDLKVADFLLNTHAAAIWMNDLMEGDVKFYGDSTVFLKRSKEIQGSGTPFGNTDYSRNFNYEHEFLTGEKADGVSKLNLSMTYLSTGGQTKTINIYGQTCFRGVTVKNSETTTIHRKSLSEALNTAISYSLRKPDEPDKKLTANEKKFVEERVNKLLAGFDDTKINDAQSYITLPEFIRRIIYRGDYFRYKPLIEKLLDPNANWNEAELDEFVQVQKNFYYDLYKDPETGRIVPRQIKNAEFVLVPQWIKGTELEYINQMMLDKGIDQLNTVETSKAANHNVMTLWNDEGFLDADDFEANAERLKENYNYNYLYVQQKTPQHMDSENKAAIQVMKKIVDNLDLRGPTLKRLYDDFNNLYEANILDSAKSLLKELGVNVDDNGNIVLETVTNPNGTTSKVMPQINTKVLYDKLKLEATRRGININMLDYVTTDESGEPAMPPFMGVLSTTFENLFQSIFTNNIARQKLPGFHAAQVSSVGLNLMSAEANKMIKSDKYTKESGNIRTNDALRYHPNGQPYIEVMIPKPAALAQYDDDTALKMLQDAGMDKLIGYRIPTEGKQSMAVMKVVKFCPRGYGSTIFVPHAWVSQTGSDFDIDSIYAIWKDIKVDKNGKIIVRTFDRNKNPDDRYLTYFLRHLKKEERKQFKELAKLTDDEIKEINQRIKDNAENEDASDFSIYDLTRYEMGAEHKKKLIELANKQAGELGLMNYEEFSNLSIIKQNELNNPRHERDVRNNGICDVMISILESQYTLEENLSRSNFDNIKDSMNKILKTVDGKDTPEAKIKKNRSAFNVLDQTDYQNDVIGGLKLKAFSVTRDTFDSICNRTRTFIADDYSIKTIIDASHLSNIEIEALKDRFEDIKIYDEDKKLLQIKHNTIGWSSDYRNSVGSLLTPYTSQTTAHILDAVKEGAAKNVNDLTFTVYKTFPDVGADYDTAISFMAHPGMTRLVNIYNKNKSIYAKRRNKNFVHLAIKEIAKELGMVVDEKETIESLIQRLNTNYNTDLVKLFGILNPSEVNFKISLDATQGTKLPFNAVRQLNEITTAQTIANESSPVEGISDERKMLLLSELGVILQYNSLATLGKVIDDTARLCNPDKGTKQSIYATRQVFENAKGILSGPTANVLYCRKMIDDKVANIPFLSAIFPGIDGNLLNYITSPNESNYKPLNLLMKYSTALSIAVSEKVFVETQNPNFRSLIALLQDSLQEPITEDVNNAFTKYIIKHKFYHNYGEDTKRIFGFNSNLTKEFTPKNIRKLTKAEKEEYLKLSPAQKIAFIKSHYRDGRIADYLTVNLFNANQYANGRGGVHNIDFSSDFIDDNTAIRLFDDMYNNEDFILHEAAVDLIRYAIAVEGLSMKRGGISRIIPNTALKAEGIVDYAKNAAREIVEGQMSDEEKEEIVENFIRSHSRLSQIPVVENAKINGKYEIVSDTSFSFGIICLAAENAERIGFGKYEIDIEHNTKTFVPYKYVRYGKQYEKKMLHKVIVGKDGFVYIYPLIPLNESEFGYNPSNYGHDVSISMNDANNENLYPEIFYTTIIDQIVANNDNLYDARTKFADLASEFAITKNYEETVDAFDLDRPPYGFEESFKEAKRRIESLIAAGLGQPGGKNGAYIQANIGGTKPGLLKDAATIYIDGQLWDIWKPNLANHEKLISTVNKIKGTLDYKIAQLKKEKLFLESEKPVQNAMINALGRQHGNNEGISKIRDLYHISRHIDAKEVVANENAVSTDDEGIKSTRNSLNIASKELMHDMNRRAYVGKNPTVKDILNKLSARGINIHDTSSIAGNEKRILVYYTNFIRQALNQINDLSKAYYVDESNQSYAMNSDKVIDMVKNNEDYRRKVISDILDILAFNKIIEKLNNVQLTTDEEDLKPIISELNKLLDDITKNPIVYDATKRIIKDYISQHSNNPLIREKIIDVDNPFNSISAFESWITDVQEAGIPIIQILNKDVTENIGAADKKAQADARAVRKDLVELERKALENHSKIRFDKLFDTATGKLHRDYDKALRAEYDRLRLNIRKKQGNDVQTIVERLRAENEFSKFLTTYFERPLVPEYYKALEKLNDSILNDPKNPLAAVFFASYQKLIDERNSLFSLADANGNYDETTKEKLKDVNLRIDNFLNIYDEDGELKYESDPEAEAALNAVLEYIDKKNGLNAIYFTRKPKIGAEKLMQKYQDIVDKLENRDSMGRIQTDEVLLQNNEEYKEAVEWLNNNTTVVYDDIASEELQKAFKTLRKKTEYDSKMIARLKHMMPEILDSDGVIDGRKVTREDYLNQIRENTRHRYDNHSAFSDTRLISNGPRVDEVYSKAFYKQMTTNGTKTEEYLEIVNAINNILRKVYDNKKRVVETYLLSKQDLKELVRLYEKLDNTRVKENTTDSSAIMVSSFIQQYVKFETNEEEYNRQKDLADLSEDIEWKRLWYKVNGISSELANNHLYSTAVPVDAVKSSYLDVGATNAIRAIHKYQETINTPYYYKAYLEAKRKGDAYFNEWYEKNHIYNPNTHRMQPLPIWTTTKIIGSNYLDATRVLRSHMQSKEPVDDYKNSKYDEDAPIFAQYKKGSNGGKYDNPEQLNEYEIEYKKKLEEVFKKYGKTDRAKRYLANGYLPVERKAKSMTIGEGMKEAAKTFGFYTDPIYNTWRESEQVDWSADSEMPMPMLQLLTGTEKLKPLPRREDYNFPKREDYADYLEYEKIYKETKAKFEKDFDKVVEENKKIIEANEKYRKENTSENWSDVISNFIIKAGHYNAVQDNKHLLYFGLEVLNNTSTVKTRVGKGLIKNTWQSSETDPIHYKEKNTGAIELQKNTIRRIVYNQFKENSGALTRIGNTLQALSSAKYMMGNITGGVANVTYGFTQIAMESFAGDYFSTSDFWKAKAFYYKGTVGYLCGVGKETAINLQDGLCKFMNILEFDNIVGLQHIDKVNANIELLRNLGYSPQTSGEHMMQNTTMFAMMYSHRVYEDPITKELTIGTLKDYLYNLEEQALLKVIGNDENLRQKYNDFKKNIMSNEKEERDYATFAKFIQHRFMLEYFDDNKRKEFIKTRNDIEKTTKAKFETLPRVIDQFKLGDDGFITWNDDSKFAEVGDDIAYKLSSRFANKVISVNKKIHGVYDRMGGARLESKWYGGIVMQYHKHLYPGVMKRYRWSGYFNETRNTIEKGAIKSFYDFLKIPFDVYRNNIAKAKEDGLSEGDINRLEGIQNYFKECVRFIHSYKLQYGILPRSEQANMRRMLGDLCGIGSALLMTLLLYWRKDEDSTIWNFAVYEMDRLASESALYSPTGAFTEGKKLYSSPVAVQGSVKDLWDGINIIWSAMFDEDYDPLYSSGMYAGENKLVVRVKRNIPIYRNITMIERLKRNNSYYKLGENVLGFFNVKRWGESLGN